MVQNRRQSYRVNIGNVSMGGGQPVLVQSMTNTPTSDVQATAAQVIELAKAGSELVRFTVKDEDDAKAVPYIVEAVRKAEVQVPLVGDFHYNGHILLQKYPDCAQALDKFRINPGNVGSGDKHDDNYRTMVEAAIRHDKAVRIGVNGGSLDRELLARLIEQDKENGQPLGAKGVFLEAMVQSALQSAKAAEGYGLSPERIVLSAKVSRVPEVVHVYRRLAQESRYALHVGLTEAGMGMTGMISSAAALGILLAEGIGDTIRVSLTPAPGAARTQEVLAACEVLQALEMRRFTPSVTSCPGCGRTSSQLFQELARDVQEYLRQRMPVWKAQGYARACEMKVAVMGCIVNGPGESREVNIGISLPGRGENPLAPVFADGKHVKSLQGDDLAQQFFACLEEYVKSHYAQ